MFNLDIKQRVLSRTKIGELPTLPPLVEYIAAEEASVTESHDLHSPAFASTSSSYKNVKKPCNFCGESRHSPSNSLEDRKKMYRAFGKSCNKSGKQNHLSNVCTSPGRHSQPAKSRVWRSSDRRTECVAPSLSTISTVRTPPTLQRVTTLPPQLTWLTLSML